MLSGIVFSIAASLMAVLIGRSWAAPVRLVAAVALGPAALQPDRPLLPALLWGMGLHLLYSAATDVLFAWLLAAIPARRRSGGTALAAALVYTLIWWLASFYAIAPLLGWNWFAERTQFLPQFVLQVGVWGGALGAYFAQQRVRSSL